MAVTLTPVYEEQRLAVTGDVRASLLIPANPPRETDGKRESDAYYIAFSDGSLVMAYHDEKPSFYVMAKGAGSVRIDAQAGSFSVDGDIDWINVASNHAATAFASKEPASLPLFEGLASMAG